MRPPLQPLAHPPHPTLLPADCSTHRALWGAGLLPKVWVSLHLGGRTFAGQRHGVAAGPARSPTPVADP